MPLISALGIQEQVDLCEFKAILVYRRSSRTARAITQRNLVLKNKTKQNLPCPTVKIIRNVSKCER